MSQGLARIVVVATCYSLGPICVEVREMVIDARIAIDCIEHDNLAASRKILQVDQKAQLFPARLLQNDIGTTPQSGRIFLCPPC